MPAHRRRKIRVIQPIDELCSELRMKVIQTAYLANERGIQVENAWTDYNIASRIPKPVCWVRKNKTLPRMIGNGPHSIRLARFNQLANELAAVS